jgi:phosphosulfolactate phosphohydrolase-like enzyme
MLIDKKYGTNIKRMLKSSAHGLALIEAGFDGDIDVCAELDTYAVLPVYQDRQITRLGPDRAR